LWWRRRTRERAATYWYDNFEAGKGDPIPDHFFKVEGSLLSTEHLAVVDRTKEDALNRLRQRRHDLQTELKTLNKFLTLAQACTEYQSHTDDDEDCDVELVDDRDTAADPDLLHVVEDLLALGLSVSSFGQDEGTLAMDGDTARVSPRSPRGPEAVEVAAFDRGQFQEPGLHSPDRLSGPGVHRQPADETEPPHSRG